MDYRICPNPDCMENVPNTTQLFKGKDEVFECVKCGYQEAKQVKVRINKAQARREQEEITVRMVADLIPAPKTPNIYFKESELIEAGREENYRLKSTRNCWAYAISELNVLHFPNRVFAVHRESYVETIAHETAHLSPKRGYTIEDLEKEEVSVVVKGWQYETINQAEKLKRNDPEIYVKIEQGWPDNKIPDCWTKEEFKGKNNPRNVINNRFVDNWGAGFGHGEGWFHEYHNYLTIIKGKYHDWISKGDNNAEKKYSTYSQGWFNQRGYQGNQATFRSWAEAERFGEEFGRDTDTFDGDYLKN